ncbi:MAG: type II toxin-antitoxin system prevent-host-death family antitoxin [Thermoanaerobaculia bacterium]
MKTAEVGTFEAKNRLSQLLQQVAKGHRIYITRRGRRVALLTRADEGGLHPGGGSEPIDLLELARKIRGAARTGPESLRALVDEGRR